MNFKTEIEGHTLEFRECHTGSYNPWALDFADEHKLPLMITSDMAEFLLLDGDAVYRLKDYGVTFDPDEITTWKDVKSWIDKYCSPRKSLTKTLASLKEYKEQLESNSKLLKEWRNRT